MKKILSLIILSSLLPAFNPQEASSKPNLIETNELLITQTAQTSTRTIEYRWPRVHGTATSFEIPSDYRAVTYDAGEKFVEGQSYNDVHILVFSPEEYESWRSNPSRGFSMGITVNIVFDAEQYWMMDLHPDALLASGTNQNRHGVSVYSVGNAGNDIVGGTGDYIGVIVNNHRDLKGNAAEVVFNESHMEVAEMILKTFDYLPR